MERISRRGFLEASTAAAAGLAASPAPASPAAPPAPDTLPWQREPTLREAARHLFIRNRINPASPVPDVIGIHKWKGQTQTAALTNPEIKAGVWGPAHRITISMIKTDVQDRRISWPRVVPLSEIVAGAYSPANADAIPVLDKTTRGVPGYLVPEGGRAEPYAAAWHAYPFPCQKPVGQIILMADALEGAPQPETAQSCSDGVLRFDVEKGRHELKAELVLSMTRNLYALRCDASALSGPLALRLYRHQDQGHLDYMTPDGRYREPPPVANILRGQKLADKARDTFRYEDDAAWNGPFEPPEAGSDGRYFWVRQKMPAEKTFPGGFHYVMMGLVAAPSPARLETAQGEKHLGTPPSGQAVANMFTSNSHSDEVIANAPGAAATARLASGGPVLAYVAVVTELDGSDIMAEARRRLDAAEKAGFDVIAAENERWYGDLYDRRENGRVFFGGAPEGQVSEDVRAVFASWYCKHGGGCQPDMRKYQATASYARVESDWQPWHGYPCYNDGIFEYTIPAIIRDRADSIRMWKALVEHWWPACRDNARDMYSMPGMALMHGYLPPVKPDRYVHTNLSLEICMATMAQVLKPIWDEWDYGRDPELLRHYYPMLRDMTRFYAGYLKEGDDKLYHIVPTVEQERWGIWPRFSHSRDTTGSLCGARWALESMADAAERLGVDAAERTEWRRLASRLAPYPMWKKPEGWIYAGTRGVEPLWFPGDHEYFEGVFPATMTGEINLDSDAATRDAMIRTARMVEDETSAEVLVLLGACPEIVASVFPSGAPERPIDGWETLRAEVNRYPERLINSRSGRIHLFPCVPSRASVAFRRFRARGGFLVSASRTAAGVDHVEIEAQVAAPCAILNPWPGRGVRVREAGSGRAVRHRLEHGHGECIRFDARVGGRYTLVPA